jgi:hypothetical protein
MSELDFFYNNRNNSGYASPDDKVVINPFTSADKEAVARNEAIRVYLRNNPTLLNYFSLSPEQKETFGSYSPNEADVKGTVIGRLLTGDPSAQQVPSQQSFLDYLMSALKRMR